MYESGEFTEQTEDGQQRVLGHIPVGDGMVGTITLLDPNQHQQQLQEETKQRKRKTKAIPYQTQFAHLTQVHSQHDYFIFCSLPYHITVAKRQKG